MAQIILFTDLDDTLFTSCRKTLPTDDFQPAAYLKDGVAISYTSPTQQTFFSLWQKNSIIIPVTARNLESFKRVSLHFQQEVILNYGGIILNKDGSIDTQWLSRSRKFSRQSTPHLEQLAQSLTELSPECYTDLSIRLIRDFDTVFYLLVKSQSGNQHNLFQASIILKPYLNSKDKLHLNENNLAIIPAWLDKAHAVSYLQTRYRQQFGQIISLGMGDSLIDLAFMKCCDYWITPQSSQIDHAISLPRT